MLTCQSYLGEHLSLNIVLCNWVLNEADTFKFSSTQIYFGHQLQILQD